MINMHKLTAHVCIVLMMVQCAGTLHAQSEHKIIILREQQLRERVKIEVLPKYPREALKNKSTGIVVMQIDFNREGITNNFETVEAADPRFVTPAIKALKQWRFTPIVTSDGTIAGGRGKLTFYFFWKDGRGWCTNPLIYDKNRNARTR
jgi:TonB family protein